MFMKVRLFTLLRWVSDSLGPEYGEGCILNLEATWDESEPRTPLICILSIGSDPSAQICALAKAKEIGNLKLSFYLPCLVSLSVVCVKS